VLQYSNGRGQTGYYGSSGTCTTPAPEIRETGDKSWSELRFNASGTGTSHQPVEVVEELLESSKLVAEIIESRVHGMELPFNLRVHGMELPFNRNESPFHRSGCFVLPGSQTANEMVLLGMLWAIREIRDAFLIACVAYENIIYAKKCNTKTERKEAVCTCSM